MGRVTGRIAFLTLFLFGIGVVVPPGALPDDDLPVSWAWSWLSQRPVWSAAVSALGAPVMAPPRPFDGEHHVPAGETDASGGAGRAARQAAGTLPAYQPYEPDEPVTTTGVAEPGFDARTSRRLPDEATARSDVYANADGSFTRRAYGDR
jgi:hypothetical protein